METALSGNGVFALINGEKIEAQRTVISSSYGVYIDLVWTETNYKKFKNRTGEKMNVEITGINFSFEMIFKNMLVISKLDDVVLMRLIFHYA